jgi:hypothetical protein
MSTFSCSSVVCESLVDMWKKASNKAGICDWCLLSHNGVKSLSGKIGDPGDRGESGECSSTFAG